MDPKQYKLIYIAHEMKPPVAAPCNNCGWCCLTEVCPTGIELTGNREAPCTLLKADGDRHYCLVGKGERSRDIGIGTGCDSISQREMIANLIARKQGE